MRGQDLKSSTSPDADLIRTCKRTDLPVNTPDPAALEALREFAIANNESAFAHMVTAALSGEQWAVERATDALVLIGERMECDGHHPGPLEPMGVTVYCDDSCNRSRRPAIYLAVIQETDTSHPDGGTAKGFTDSLSAALTGAPRTPDPHAILRPRAVAALVALRRKPLSPVQLSHAIGDDSVPETRELLAAMSDPRDPAGATVRLVKQYVELTDDGVAWLETHGLSVTRHPASLAHG